MCCFVFFMLGRIFEQRRSGLFLFFHLRFTLVVLCCLFFSFARFPAFPPERLVCNLTFSFVFVVVLIDLERNPRAFSTAKR